ncbi:hypothetical protein CRM22_008147 [Opisthorchis felineus]|uniref:Essential MCU regulator, mitochondrial n=1 Tax=Opisthorchis felineus TaxID=147828 RepID=A0A4S2LCJ6_OPIFE|nr:hypothetical protein CRM22_008147 [Opisthorchis felineus]
MLRRTGASLYSLRCVKSCQINSKRLVQCYSGEEGSCTSTGALHQRPHITHFGVPGVAALVCISIFTGAMISKNAAQFLEENEIFVPEDD